MRKFAASDARYLVQLTFLWIWFCLITVMGFPSLGSGISLAQSSANPKQAGLLEKPLGKRPGTAHRLIESCPELKRQIAEISSEQVRQNLLASIEYAMKLTRPDGDIIAIGKLEVADGFRTLQDGCPQGGALILQAGERKMNFAAPGYMTTNGSVYWGRDKIYSSHWPWFVTSLQSGKPKAFRCVTLQHQPAVIEASNENQRYVLALPTVRLEPLTKPDRISISTEVRCDGQPFPAHVSLGLPGFTNPAVRLRLDADDGKLEFDIPRVVVSKSGC